jgi:hypothetical protein
MKVVDRYIQSYSGRLMEVVQKEDRYGISWDHKRVRSDDFVYDERTIRGFVDRESFEAAGWKQDEAFIAKRILKSYE